MSDLRNWLTHLANQGRLRTFKPGLDPHFEIMGLCERLDGVSASFFPSPKNHDVPIVSGLLQQRQWIAEALNCQQSDVLELIQSATANPLDWAVVDSDKAPVHEVVYQGKDIDLKKIMPVIQLHEDDAGPFVTSGIVNGLHLKTGKQNAAIHRMQVHGPDKLGILMLPRDLHAFYQEAQAENKALPVTITIGHHPAIELASQTIAERDHCELNVAGALLGKPLPVVKSLTNDVMITAEAEFSIEGRILPNMRALEGPFGEFPKYYSGIDMQPFIQIDCITHRKKPIYRVNNSSGSENIFLGGIPREATLLQRMRINFPTIADLRLTVGGQGRYHLVVQMKKSEHGQAKNVIANAFGCHYDIKMVTVVDMDIDIDQKDQIEWAVATRFEAHRDLVVIQSALGSKLDPSAGKHGVTDKVGLDATAYLDEGQQFLVTKVPNEAGYDLESLTASNQDFLSDYLQ